MTAHLTDTAHYGITLLLATGSDAHLASLRAVAAEQGMSLDANGLQRGGKLVAAASENSIYSALGMQPVPPELREGRSEVAQALAGTLPELVTDEISPESFTRTPTALTGSIGLRPWRRPR